MVINDNIENAVDNIDCIMKAEKLKQKRNEDLFREFVVH